MATATQMTQASTDELRSGDSSRVFTKHTTIKMPLSDAALFTLAPPLARNGVNLKEKQTWLDSWDGPIELDSSNLKVTVSGDSAFAHGFVQMKGTPKMAGREISFWMRSTVCFHREGGGWRIVHEHASVPFYMDGTQRPAFDLKP
jgi:ketosteroid isomerase-like protein